MHRIVERNVDIPVVGSGAGGGLSGFLPGQSYSVTAEQIVDNPVPRQGGAGGLQGLHRGQSSTAFPEQIAEFPDPCGGLQDFQPVQGSAASSSVFSWTSWRRVLRTFRNRKKCEDPAHPGVGTGCALELMDAMRSGGYDRRTSWGTTWGAASSPCC